MKSHSVARRRSKTGGLIKPAVVLAAALLGCCSSGLAAEQSEGLSIFGTPLNPGGGTAATAEALRVPKLPEQGLDVRIDGRLDDAVWRTVPAFDHMTVTQPDLRRRGAHRTHTFIFHTERGLYVGAWNEQPAESLIARQSGRDTFGSGDYFQVMIDSSGEGQYGYWFIVGLGGTVADGTLLPERRFRHDWDGAWHGKAVRLDDGWSVEMFLPWSMMNMPEAAGGRRRMALHITRDLAGIAERWAWPALPRTEPRFISGFQPVELEGVAPRQEVSVYPYATYSDDRHRDVSSAKAGADIFWRPSAAFFLNAALNPDFGQVEADDVVVNLSAYETFFAEKRLFFLENNDIFTTGSSDYSGTTKLLHTRRIGTSVGARRGAPDLGGEPYDGYDLGKPVDLLVGAKGVGQWRKSRWGVFAAAEDETTLCVDDCASAAQVPGRDFGVARWLFEDTTGGGRRAIGWLGAVADHPARRALSQGIDAQYQSADSVWKLHGELLQSHVADTSGYGAILNMLYAPRRGRTHWARFEAYDNRIDLGDIGYLWRNDLITLAYDFSHREQDLPNLRERQTYAWTFLDFNGNSRLLGATAFLSRTWTYRNKTQFQLTGSYRPRHWDDRNSRGNGDFKVEDRATLQAFWSSDWSKPLGVNMGVSGRAEGLGGTSWHASFSVQYRPVERVRIAPSIQYFRNDSWLLWQGGTAMSAFEMEQWSPRFSIDAFFTAGQQLRLEMQWTGLKAFEDARYRIAGDGALNRNADSAETAKRIAISDVVLQVRYRWQIAPLSDLFVVYNRGGNAPPGVGTASFPDLFSDAFAAPNRETLVVKLRYRFGT